MKKTFLVTILFLLSTTPALADSLRVGCVKLELLCSATTRCVWWGNPGQALNVELTKKSSTNTSELFEGRLEHTIEGQKFTLNVLQNRITGKNPVNYINLEMPISKDVIVSSEGLIYSHVKYVNKSKNQGVTIRCSTGI